MPTSLDRKPIVRTAVVTAGFWILATLLLPHLLWGQDLDDLKNGVVKISAHVEGQQPKVGTGFIVRVDKDAVYVVTVAHVTEGDPKPTVTFFSLAQQPFAAQVIGIEGGGICMGLPLYSLLDQFQRVWRHWRWISPPRWPVGKPSRLSDFRVRFLLGRSRRGTSVG